MASVKELPGEETCMKLKTKFRQVQLININGHTLEAVMESSKIHHVMI